MSLVQLTLRLTALTLLFIASWEAQAATWYASASNSAIPPSGTACTSSAPCTFAYANGTKLQNGDTLLLYSGTYNDQSVRIGVANVTISAVPAVVNALEASTPMKHGFIQNGAPDTRPYFVGTRLPAFTIAAAGVTLSYLRIRGLADCTSPPNCQGYLSGNAVTGVLEVNAYPTLIDHMEIFSGGTIVKVYVGRQVTIQNSNLHGAGYYPVPYPFAGLAWYPNDGTHSDPHVIAILNTGPIGSDFSNGIRILDNSLWEAVGNAVQEQSDCYGNPKTIFRYLTMSGNHMYNNHKQAWDAKGTQDVIFSDNLVENNDYGHIAINTPNDCSSNGPMDRWEVFNNVFRYSKNTVSVWSNRPNCSNHHWYNNVIYNNQTDAQYNGPAIWMCGDRGSTFYNNTVFNNGNFGPHQNGGIIDCGSGDNIRNNIFYNNGTRGSDYGNITGNQYGCNQGGTPSNNYIYGKTAVNGTSTVKTCYATGNCAGFVDIASNNFQLLSASPARNTGLSNLGSPYNIDILGQTRVAPWDLGAFSYGGSIAALPAPANLRVSQ